MAEEASRIIRNQAPKRVSSDIEDQNLKKKNKKVKSSISMPSNSNLGVCANPACRAAQSSDQEFCKRCSCCVCCQFDDNKDPSLWLECAPIPGSEGSCGFSCHIECVLKHKVGDNNSRQLHLDGSYRCASCRKVSSIIECWTKQLNIAKDAKRVDVLCYRIFLCYRLLDGTSRFKELHKFIKEMKPELEREFGPLNEVATKTTRLLVTRINAAKRVQDLCKHAIEKAEELMASNTTLIEDINDKGKAPMEFDLNTTPLPDMNEELRLYDATNKSQFIDDKGSVSSSDDFENTVKAICELESGGHVSKEFRLKFLTWFGLKSNERQRKTVNGFVKTMKNDPSSLAEQLLDSFSYIMFSGRQ